MYCHKTGSIWDSHLSQWGEDFASEIHSRQGTSKPCIVQAAGHRNATCLHGLGVLSWSSEFCFVLQWAWWDWQHSHWPYLYISISSVETLCLTKPHASGLCPGTFLVWEYSFCMHFCLEVPGRCFLMFFWSLREVQGDLNGRELMRREESLSGCALSFGTYIWVGWTAFWATLIYCLSLHGAAYGEPGLVSLSAGTHSSCEVEGLPPLVAALHI